MSLRCDWMLEHVLVPAFSSDEDTMSDFFSSYQRELLRFLDDGDVGDIIIIYTIQQQGAVAGASAAAATTTTTIATTAVSSSNSTPYGELRLSTTTAALSATADATTITRAVYFLRTTGGRVETPSSPVAAQQIMSSAVEYAILPKQPLLLLERLIQDVYIQMVDPDCARIMDAKQSTGTQSHAGYSVANTEFHGEDSLRSDLANHMHKFVSQITHTVQQVTDNIQLPMPSLSADHVALSPVVAARDTTIVGKVEHAVEQWVAIIVRILEEESRRKRNDADGPMAEVNFWRDRSASLSSVYEQLSLDNVRHIIKVAELAEVSPMPAFKEQLQELMKLYVEVKDNVKFLSTLERHFKNFARGTLTSILETIPSMMNSLRMIWIISRHYNKDDRMGPLMRLIAREIADQVARHINIRTMFRRKPAEVMKTIKKGKEVLDLWYSTYQAVRERIEKSGNVRWNFLRKELFEQTSYMSRICDDLYEVAETLDQFGRFLGNKLKTVTGDIKGIDEVLQSVHDLVKPLENMPFNVFDRRKNHAWDQTMRSFHEKVKKIEFRTTQFIHKSFKKLRSADGAFELLQNFKNIESRKAIHDQMMDKFKNILQQYGREVDGMQRIFEAGRAAPPVTKNTPPVAGAIIWARSLYHRIKKSILRFRTMEGLLESDEGKAVCDKYLRVAQSIVGFEEQLYHNWTQRVATTINNRLKEPILRYEVVMVVADEHGSSDVDGGATDCDGGGGGADDENEPAPSSVDDGRSQYMSVRSHRASGPHRHHTTGTTTTNNYMNSSHHHNQQHHHHHKDSSSSSHHHHNSHHPNHHHNHRQQQQQDFFNRREKELQRTKRERIVVNLHPDLLALIKETKYLDRIGFKPPELALNLTLQERKYYDLVERLNAMLVNYESVLGRLSDVERLLLSERIRELKAELAPGFSPLNWNSLAIPDFIAGCDKGIQLFEGKVESVQKYAGLIRKAVDGVRNAQLVDLTQYEDQTEVMSVEELHDRLDKQRLMTIDALVRKYQSIGPHLIMIEKVVCDLDTGMAPQLAEYYQYWEHEVFVALTHMIAAGIQNFERLLSLQVQQRRMPQVFSVNGTRVVPYVDRVALPLIKVVASMHAPHIVATPNIQDIYNFLSKLLKSIPESAKSFVRWMYGTCKECQPATTTNAAAATTTTQAAAAAAAGAAAADEEESMYTFYNDISKNSLVVKTTLQVTQQMHRVIQGVDKYIEGWKHYDKTYNLFSQKKLASITLERLRSDARHPGFFDQKLSSLTELVTQVVAMPVDKNISFVRVNTTYLVSAIKKQARVWIERYGDVLRSVAEDELHRLVDTIGKYEQKLMHSTDELDDLKYVLRTIETIQDSSMGMELAFLALSEQFQTLKLFGIPVKRKDSDEVARIAHTWSELVRASKQRDAALNRTKQSFTVHTREEVHTFQTRMQAYAEEFRDNNSALFTDLERGWDALVAKRAEVQLLEKKREELALSEKLFALPPTSFESLRAVQRAVAELDTLYTIYNAFTGGVKQWSALLWNELDVASLVRGVDAYQRQLQHLPSALHSHNVWSLVHDRVMAFRESLPLISMLKNDAIRPRHWQELMDSTNVVFTMDTQFTLGNLFAMELHQYAPLIQQITSRAMQESKIEKDLQKVASVWNHTNLPLAVYASSGHILQDCSEILTQLEDHALQLQAMSNSAYAAAFSADIRNWEKRVSHVSSTIAAWLQVQRQWMYLEGIYIGSDDIRMQLPEAAKRFDRIDASFKKIMSVTAKSANVLKAAQQEHRLDELRLLSSELDQCQKSLSDYLERKRHAFPRFFFISDDELLSILGSADPTCVQNHMLKLFSDCKSLQFIRGNSAVAGMVAPKEAESFAFRTHVNANGKVEEWMTRVEEEMRRTLHSVCKEAVYTYPKRARAEWIQEQLGMISVVGSQIWWTWQVEDAFRAVRQGNKHAMKELSVRLSAQIDELVAAVRDLSLPQSQRKKLNTLIIIDVHARDIVDRFVRDSILDAREFAWESQLRFYWDREDDDVVVRQCTGRFHYGYEYLGLAGRLVITPLTDRCYMTLTQALTFHLGGSPAGPAGTGKTETVKDLAKALGLQCIVMNCGSSLDYRAMGSIFSGLAQTGAWGCFDEFNRIDVEVLSVVSSQLQAVQNALHQQRTKFELMGAEINLRPSVGFFITMNPGYEGRTELPDNLKALFRPVTMVVPDMQQICEIMLFSEGFTRARVLAQKMTVLYKLAGQQLSKQPHYDFGLRALKSVLVMAGALKREYTNTHQHASRNTGGKTTTTTGGGGGGGGGGGDDEEMVLMSALRDMNLPKFVYEDAPLFLGLLADLFPGLECADMHQEMLVQAVRDEFEELGYHVCEMQVAKVVRLYETMLTRHTTMVVGPTAGGKSVIIDVLARALQRAFKVHTKLYVLNPKAVTVPELYGVLDSTTRDWCDGLLSKIFRDVNEPLKAGQREARYIVFDGDVDALWVENMNSVMDDNKVLTLPNGERVRMLDHVKLLFEVGDLRHASLATVSRCGMVYVDPRDLGYEPYFHKWLRRPTAATAAAVNGVATATSASSAATVTTTTTTTTTTTSSAGAFVDADTLLALFHKYVPVCVEWVLARGDSIVPRTALSMVRQLCSWLSTLLVDDVNWEPDSIESVFIFALVWSVGATTADRAGFDKLVRDTSERVGRLPADLLFDYSYDPVLFRWVPWSAQVGAYEPPVPFRFSRILVPTVDTVRVNFLLANQRRLLLVGESGSAKTVSVKNFMNTSTLAADYNTLIVSFSSRTTSLQVQRIIDDNVEKRSGHIYGPVNGKRMMVFVDDLNMPVVDKYGTQQPLALLKYLIQYGAMYERGGDLQKRVFRDLEFIGGMAPPGGGRGVVDPRFVSLFNVCAVLPPSESTLRTIFTSILGVHLENFEESVRSLCAPVTDCALVLHQHVLAELPATPLKFHYIFNLRDLSRLYEGLLFSCPERYSTPDAFWQLYRHEAMRVYHDRLVCAEDQAVVRRLVTPLVEQQQGVSTTADGPLSDADGGAASAVVDSNEVVFGDFLTAMDDEPRLYSPLPSVSAAGEWLADRYLKSYNQLNQEHPLQLVLFDDAVRHLCRILRTLAMPRGNVMLVGVGGSGKQSLARLAAYIAGYQLFEVSLTRNYSEAEFRDDLKRLYQMAAVQPVVFLFTDNDAKDENFFELINNMLTSGVVPALFDDDEKSALLDAVRAEVAIPSNENCWRHFIGKCRDNLHVCLCLSPSGTALRRRCRSFPGLIANTVIDWFFPWPTSALATVGAHYFPADAPLVRFMVSVHESVIRTSARFEATLGRVNHVTPRNYLDYIETYRRLVREKADENAAQYQRLDRGLTKLMDAQSSVHELSEQLADQKVIVDQKRREVQLMIAQITERSAEVETKRRQAAQREDELKQSYTIVTQQKTEAEQALQEAEPALAEAAAALENLDASDIREVRRYTEPPHAVMQVCQCVQELKPLGIEDPSAGWKGAQKMMSDGTFLQRLKSYARDDIKDSQMKRLRKILKSADMTLANLKRISKAGAGLFQWVLAMVNYNAVAKGVEPKRLRVRTMEKEMGRSQADLERIKGELECLNREVAELTAAHTERSAELCSLEARAATMEKHLSNAQQLVSGLSSEQARWTADRDELGDKRARVDGDCMLAAAFLSYAGAFTYEYREALLQEWQTSDGMPAYTQPYSVAAVLSSEVEKSRWVSQGLPTDELSIQNGILTTKGRRWPLCIDPQMQALRWLQRHAKMEVRSFGDADFFKTLELCIQYGRPMLLMVSTETDIDPIITPVLERAINPATNQVMLGGDHPVDWHPNFALYLITKLANPRFTPEVAGRTMIVNFMVTRGGLSDQLLNVVVGHERADLQRQREELIQTIARNNIALVELEDAILKELTASSGNLLENEALIARLQDAKVKSGDLQRQLTESQATSSEIEKVTHAYRPVAERGAVLFFVLAELASVDSMYEFSLQTYADVFHAALRGALRDSFVDKRVAGITQHLTRLVYDFACMGIFEKHKLMVALRMVLAIHPSDGDKERLFALPPDQVLDATKQYIVRTMQSDYFVQPPTLSYANIWAQSSPHSPVVFVLSPGADPLPALRALAEERGMYPQKFKHLALGQGQSEAALKLVEIGHHRGHWVVLQNCHLLLGFIGGVLEKVLDELRKPHADFRLFLTTDPTPHFPLGILQRSLKVVTEPPDGLKLNMKGRQQANIADECDHPAYAPLVYVLSFFHAVIQERRKYGKLGWNVSYDFNDSDFAVSKRLLQMYLHGKAVDEVPWSSLRYLIGECMYGGRVTDSYDRRVLMTYLDEYMGDFIFDDHQPFHFAPGYTVGQCIDTLPLDTRAEVFGLHANAELRYCAETGVEMMRVFEKRRQKIGSPTQQLEMSVLEAIGADCRVFDVDAVRRAFQEISPLEPVTVVLLQELERWNTLVGAMVQGLSDVRKCLRGEMGMSAELEELIDALVAGEVYDGWRRHAPATKKRLHGWMEWFRRRWRQYDTWVSELEEPKSMWLGGLHVPESWLTAVVQTVCREKKWALDRVALRCDVGGFGDGGGGGDDDDDDDSCWYVEGLWLEGASWDNERNCLIKQRQGVVREMLPKVRVRVVEGGSVDGMPGTSGGLRTPVYVTSDRRNAMGDGLVFEVELAGDGVHDSHWVLQGVAVVVIEDEDDVAAGSSTTDDAVAAADDGAKRNKK